MNPIPSNGTPARRSWAILEVGSVWREDVVSGAAAALAAGTIGIVLNTLALEAAKLVPLATGNGGLFRLLVMLTGGAFHAQPGAVFKTGFHIVIGFATALFYAFALEPWLRVPSWLRGVLFATAVWLINALSRPPRDRRRYRRQSLSHASWHGLVRSSSYPLLSRVGHSVRSSPIPRLRQAKNPTSRDEGRDGNSSSPFRVDYRKQNCL
jgi:hypothetical protein